MFGAKIVGTAHYLPDFVMTNELISEKYIGAGTSEEIFKKTGIKERRYSMNLTSGDMAAESSAHLLKKTGIKSNEIDCMIVGTSTPDYFFPPTAASVIDKIKATNASGFDINAACPSFLVALQQAEMMIKSGKAGSIIVCGVDRMSKTINSSDYKTGLLFGDASASVLLESCEAREKGINHSYSKVVATDLESIYFKTPFSSDDWMTEKFTMSGRKVYQCGIELTVQTVINFLTERSLSADDYKFIIPHQSNLRIIKEIAKRLEFPLEKFLTNIERVGNTASASIPLCLSQKADEGIVKKGDRLLLVSYGAGYTVSVIDLYF